MSSFLRVEGTKIVDGDGKEVILRGAGMGGWMTMENFISGFPGCEFQIRAALAEVIGQQKSEFFFDRFLEHFFAEADAAFFKSLGLNCIRIAINYRHFEDDMNPRVLKLEGFKHLDRVVAACAKHGIYTILDMHTAPGGQNGGWHSDHGAHTASFWIHKDFQDRLVWLWTDIAKHYKDEKWIAGYNPMNEPADPEHAGLIQFYDRVYAAIQSIDPNHMLFLDGNTFASDFTRFPDDAAVRWPNAAYAIHDYSLYGFPKSPEPYERTDEQRRRMRRSYERKREWIDAQGLCVWNGEWGPVYARREYDGEATDEINERRYNVLADQLEMYHEDRLSWSIWLYKDIGFQGMVYVSRETSYMQHFKDVLHKKYRLAVDAWGANDRFVRHVYDPLVELIKREVPNEADQRLYPYPIWTLERRVEAISRNTLMGEFMVREWAEHFRGMGEKELERLAESFKFENCMKREGLNKALRTHASEST
ncbi:glycoside hydrolase family 5 protein [Laetiporus sulphureus 93-53]|uniref:Glycoside hydrolase family 5 protein n=1 Tax=Laetiporus sulphureus 93-53 TaxID=1314785 RepID=A0A165B0I3_9APHY|nr:glycoside hydrolase family 5 protein [Laetiporus sulphureus 93-53]KZS99999.1 glycoside hydrolase family 5 protein [Laetiporus sulphureus 93-53]